jgi:hypothetical protein
MNRILRQGFGLICLAALLLIAGPAYPYPYVELYSGHTDWRVGEVIGIDVLARNVTDIDPIEGRDVVLGFGFEVYFAQENVSFIGAAMGTGFEDVSDILGNNRVAGIADPLAADKLFGDMVLLAVLNFERRYEGEFMLGIVSSPVDPNSGLFTAWHHLDISARWPAGATPVPDPPTLTLLASGLAGLLAYRRLRR